MTGTTGQRASREAARRWAELSFLAPPEEVRDWRLVVLWDAAASAGLLDALPARVDELATSLELDPEAVRVVLEALAVWEVVEVGTDGSFRPGAGTPGDTDAAVLAHHAQAVRRWSADLQGRLRGTKPASGGIPPHRLARWLEALAVNARSLAVAAVDACLKWAPAAETVLELGGGHGEYGLEFARRGLEVTMQDRPEVIELARRRGVLPKAGVELFAGDFFEILPEGPFDLIYCAGVAYTYSGVRNRELYRRVRPLLTAEGGLGILGFLRGHSPVSSLFAVQMLLVADGDTHGEGEYRDWLTATGFGPVTVVDLAPRPQALVLARCR